MLKRTYLLFVMQLFVAIAYSQIPSGYYNNAEGKSNSSLKTALYLIIKDHVQRTYTNLWTDFQTTDKRTDGKVWDMYSSTSNFTFVTDQDTGSGGTVEGDKYNREHSFPNSWFGGVQSSPMYTDLFHMYPADKLVNNKRGNYPFGETAGEIYQSNSGFSKLGNSTFPGYSGVVFEPADEYKGDFARSYLYMATCYEDKIASWDYTGTVMLNQTSYPCFQNWAINLLLKWHRQDPVSEKEINRNNAVYTIQKNRNPFIDNPLFVEYIWGDRMDQIYTGIDAGAEVTAVRAWSSEKGVMITSPEKAVVCVYRIDGTLIASEQIQDQGELSFAEHGMFLVKVLTDKCKLTFKISK